MLGWKSNQIEGIWDLPLVELITYQSGAAYVYLRGIFDLV